MSLELAFTARVASFELAVDLSVGDEVVAVLGPNGAGKSSLLHTIAGLTAVDTGRITLGDEVLDDAEAEVFVPPAARRVGLLFQDYLLFPFLTARDNVAFPLRSRGVGKRAARDRAQDWLDRLGLGDLADRRPGALSGGQAQRAALARALVADPSVLLLDEPLAALDARARGEIRRALREHLRAGQGPRLVVTHDALDASVLADRVVVVEQGRVVQQGRLDEITLHPRSAFVADLAGLNVYRGVARAGSVPIEGGGVIVLADHGVGGEVHVSVHPRAVSLHLDDPHGDSARNHWPGTVVELELLGDRVRVRLDGTVPIVAEVTRESARALGLAPGQRVVASVKATELVVYPA